MFVAVAAVKCLCVVCFVDVLSAVTNSYLLVCRERSGLLALVEECVLSALVCFVFLCAHVRSYYSHVTLCILIFILTCLHVGSLRFDFRKCCIHSANMLLHIYMFFAMGCVPTLFIVFLLSR